MADRKVEIETTRRNASQILEQVIANGRDELDRASKALAFSGVAGGLTMGITGLSVAIAGATLGASAAAQFVAQLFYPLGFIAVIIGRAQLFTENTLYPVIIVLDDPRRIWHMLRLWVIVYVSNIFGAFLFAVLVERIPALLPAYQAELIRLGLTALERPTSFVFCSAIIGGWLIALVAWMVSASHWTISQIVIIWLITFIVGLGHFAHCVATSGEILNAVVTAHAGFGSYLHWLLFATLGNIVGGVTIVSLLNYGQVKAGESE